MAAVPSFPLIVDVTSPTKDAALESFNARNNISTPLFVRNDGSPTALRLVTPNLSGARAYDDFDPTGYDVAVAIGEPDEYPTLGSWKLTSGANTTPALAALISAVDLQTALNALAGVAVTVASVAAGTFAVTFTTLGAQTLLTSPTNSLAPTAAVVISRVLAGDASTYEVQIIRLSMVPYALNTTWTPFVPAAATVVTLVTGTGSVYQQDRIALDPVPYDGSFTIDGSAAIPYNADAATVQAALVTFGAPTVTGVAGGPWTITQTAFGPSTRAVDVTGLIAPIGLNGVLDLNTFSMLQRFLQTTDSIITVTLEVQLTPTGGKPLTPLQIPVKVSRDVIDYSTLLPAPGVAFYTSAEVDAIIAALASTVAFTNNTGNTAINIPTGCKLYTAKGTFTGAPGTRVLYVPVAGLANGAKLFLDYVLPATAGIVIEVRNDTSGGILLDSLTTDTSADPASLQLSFNGTAMQLDSTLYPSA